MDEKATGKKILLVDDESDFRQLLGFWLEGQGYQVIYAENGVSAIRETKAKNPDIIFMDLRMPEMSGAEAVKKIREFNTEVAIIVISSYVDDPVVSEIAKSNISGVFYKGEDFKKGLPLLLSALHTHKRMF